MVMIKVEMKSVMLIASNRLLASVVHLGTISKDHHHRYLIELAMTLYLCKISMVLSRCLHNAILYCPQRTIVLNIDDSF